MDITRNAAHRMPPAELANALRTIALIPNSYSPGSVTILLQEAAGRVDISAGQPQPVPGWQSEVTGERLLSPPRDPSPSDVAYDDMTRAWRNGDYPLAWNLADALLQYLANDGQPLTGDHDVYYARQIYVYYAPLPSLP